MVTLPILNNFNVIGSLLFGLECYHAFAHFLVLFGIRLLPRKDIARLRIYFLIDTISVFTISFIYLKQLQWLAILQMIQHGFYVVTWEISGPAKKIVSWSSLDWFKAKGSRWEWDLIVGTAFDMFVHLTLAAFLTQHCTPLEILCGVLLMIVGTSGILYNKRLAWCSPDNIPAWIQRRIAPVPDHTAFWPMDGEVEQDEQEPWEKTAGKPEVEKTGEKTTEETDKNTKKETETKKKK